MNIKGLHIIVTGGGSGLGAATARRLVTAGARVTIWDRDGDAAEGTAAAIGAQACACDVTDEASVQAALQKAGPVHGVVNCAGILIGQKLVGKKGVADLTHFEKTIAVNLTGTYNVLRLAAAQMSAQDTLDADGTRGVIINTASIAAYEGQMGQVAYSASKAGVVGMTLPAARDLARYGIRVVAIAPGAVDTPMIDSVSDDVRQAIADSIPFPSRFARPDEFAALVLHVFENDMLNGTVIRLDGATRLTAQ